jgi:assimilatory nitrate reductase catalytic subunit
MDAVPKFLSGVFSFTGMGLKTSTALSEPVTYTVPGDKRSQLVFFRGGNSTDELVCVVLLLNGKPFRLFPVGAKAGIHVPLAVVEDLFPESRLDVQIAAPEGVTGEIVIDIGLVEI